MSPVQGSWDQALKPNHFPSYFWDLFIIRIRKTKAFKLLKSLQSSNFQLSFEGQSPTYSIYLPIVKQLLEQKGVLIEYVS